MLSPSRLNSASNIVSFAGESLYTQTQQNSIQAGQNQSGQIQRIEGCWSMAAGDSSSITLGTASADRKRKCEAVMDLTEEEEKEESVPKSQKTADSLERSIALTTKTHMETSRSALSFEIRKTNNTLNSININMTKKTLERPRGLIQKPDLNLVDANNALGSIVIDVRTTKNALGIFRYLYIKHQCIANGIDYRAPHEEYDKLQEIFSSKKKILNKYVKEHQLLYGNYKLSDVWAKYLPPPNQERTFLESMTSQVKHVGSFTIHLDKLTDQESQKTSISQPGQPTTIDLSEESEDPPQITWQDDYELQLANLEVSENEHYPISIAGEVSVIQERKNTKNYRVFVQEDKNKILTKGQFDYLVIKYLKNISDQKVETRLGVTTAFTNLILAIPQNQLEGYTLTKDWQNYIDKKIKNYDLSKKLPYDAISDKFKMALGLANF